jgi:membrane AbrB-like protein
MDLTGFPGGQAAAFCITYAVGYAGYRIFKFLRVPNPGLLGSMMLTGVLSATGYYPVFPVDVVSFVAKTSTGIMLGRQIDRQTMRKIRSMLRPVLVQLVGMLAISFLCGWTLYATCRSHGISLSTAMISGTAGGIAEMMIFGLSVNADVGVVAFVQIFRIVLFLALLPWIAIIAAKLGVPRSPALDSKIVAERPETSLKVRKFSGRDWGLLLLCAFAGAGAANGLGVPAGAMLGGMIACGLLALKLDKKYTCAVRVRTLTQIGLGLALGHQIDARILDQLRILLLPTLLVTLVMLTGSVLLAILLYRTSHTGDLLTCLLCTAPAGLSQIAIYSEEVGADSLTAALFHSVRMFGIILFYPWIIMPLLS